MILQSEVERLKKGCENIGYVYSNILIEWSEYRSNYRDQIFFESLYYYISKIIRASYPEEFYQVLEEGKQQPALVTL